MVLDPDIHRQNMIINTKTIKRYDPEIFKLVISATHVALYDFSVRKSDWIKNDTDGPMFIYLSRGSHSVKLFILNRANFDNFVMPIDENTEITLIDRFIAFKYDCGKICGIRFHDEKECLRSVFTLRTLSKKSRALGRAIRNINHRLKLGVSEKNEQSSHNVVDAVQHLELNNIQFSYENSPFSVKNIEMKERMKYVEEYLSKLPEKDQNLDGYAILDDNANVIVEDDEPDDIRDTFDYDTCLYSVKNIEKQQKLKAEQEISIEGSSGLNEKCRSSNYTSLNIKLHNENDLDVHSVNKMAGTSRTSQSTGLECMKDYETSPYSVKNIEMQQRMKAEQENSVSPTKNSLDAYSSGSGHYFKNDNLLNHMVKEFQHIRLHSIQDYDNSPYSVKYIEEQQIIQEKARENT